MQVTSREINAKTATKRFIAKFGDIGNTEFNKKCSELSNLNPITADSVDSIIGNTRFTETRCHECGSTNKSVVHFNCAHTNTYDLWICIDCVRLAYMKLIAIDEEKPLTEC
jgi:hypothetical protein